MVRDHARHLRISTKSFGYNHQRTAAVLLDDLCSRRPDCFSASLSLLPVLDTYSCPFILSAFRHSYLGSFGIFVAIRTMRPHTRPAFVIAVRSAIHFAAGTHDMLCRIVIIHIASYRCIGRFAPSAGCSACSTKSAPFLIVRSCSKASFFAASISSLVAPPIFSASASL